MNLKIVVEEHVEALELDLIAALHCVTGDAMTETPESAADFVQDGYAAYVMTQGSFKGRGKGHGIRGR